MKDRWKVAYCIGIAVFCAICGQTVSASPSGTVSLPGHVRPVPFGAAFLGRVGASNRIDLTVALPIRNQASLEALINRLGDPNDSMYGRYLTPEAFAQEYGATQADYDLVKGYLRSSGLTITKEYLNRLAIGVSGPASAVETVLHVKLSQYQSVSGRIFHSIDIDPSLPGEIATRVQGIIGLDNSNVAHPMLRRGIAHSATQRPASLTGPTGTFGPVDLTRAYNLTAANLTSAGLPATLNGAGQVVALVELYGGYLASDISRYTSYFSSYFGSGFTAPLINISVDGYNTSTFDVNNAASESTTDICDVLNFAPGVKHILVFEGKDSLYDCLAAIATDTTDTGTGKVADIVSISYGGGEDIQGASTLNPENSVFQELASQGQTVFVSSGDTGAFGDYDFTGGTNLIPQDPSSQPYVTGVGGTTLSVNSVNGAWTGEGVWNDSDMSGSPDDGIGGGGISGYWPIPSYQSANIPASNKSGYSTRWRNVPDVALNADYINSPYAWYFDGSWQSGGIGGTSCAAPSWAGFTALVNQERIARGHGDVGFLNSLLYQVAAGSSYASDFHDITSGNIGVPSNVAFSASTGYDIASGWGSFVGAGLIGSLAGSASGSTYVLWNDSGMASLWKIPASGSIASVVYGPYSGWTPAALSSDTSGSAYILWNNTNGAASLWKISSALVVTTSQTFGPYSGWTAKSLAVGTDGNIRVLWNNTNGAASIFDIALGSSYTSTAYGPFAGWTAQQLAVDTSNDTRVLWSNPSAGEASIWNITSAGILTSQALGPFAGWQVQSLAVGSDGLSRIVWEQLETKEASVFQMASNGSFTSQVFGPYSGWYPVGLAVKTSGDLQLIWDSANNQLSIFDISSSQSVTSSAYGPFSGWQAIGVAAGP